VIDCSPTELMQGARCLENCLGGPSLVAIQTYLLAIMAKHSTEPNVLINEARCLQNCIPAGFFPAIIAKLLCDIADVDVTGQTCIVCIAEDGVPTDPAPCDCSLAYNMLGEFWFWNSLTTSWMPISV
jgi:hypothetical protein